jgi:hypothetical protein
LIGDIPIVPDISLQFLYLCIGGLKLARKLFGNAPRAPDLLFGKMSGLLQEVKKGFPFAVQRSAPFRTTIGSESASFRCIKLGQ